MLGPIRATADPASPRWSVFRNELRHHGYADGVNLAVSWREGVEDWRPPRDEWAEVMDDIRRLSPDVIVTTSHGWARALNAVISTIPIVVSALSPVEQEVISSLREHLATSRVSRSTLAQTFTANSLISFWRRRQRCPMLHFSAQNEPIAACGSFGVTQSSAASASRNFSIRITMKLSSVPWSGKAQRQFSSWRMPTMSAHTDRIARLARQYRLPLMSPFRRLTEAGGLMSYGIDWSGVDRGLAVYTARVLGGTKPSELPFEQPSRYELVLNLQTADDLGLTFPNSLMAFADDMLERDRSP